LHKNRECEEVAILESDSYRFAGTFGFLERLALKGRDPAYVFDDLSSGLLPPNHIKNVLSCSLEQMNGDDINDGHDGIITDFIERGGLQESSMVARTILTNAMIGSVKKKKMALNQEAESLYLKSRNFLSTNFAKAGLSLVVILTLSAGLAYLTL